MSTFEGATINLKMAITILEQKMYSVDYCIGMTGEIEVFSTVSGKTLAWSDCYGKFDADKLWAL